MAQQLRRFHPGLWILTLLLACLLIPVVASHPQAQAAAPSKKLVLIGGGLETDNAQIYNTVVKLAGGPGVARIGIVTAASEVSGKNDESSTRGKQYATRFKTTYKAADAQWIPIDLKRVENNSSPEVVRQINSMTGFYFTGGQQTRIISSFYLKNRVESPALQAIRQKFEQGALIAGSSAGAASQTSNGMLTPGGESYEALRFGTFTGPTKTDYLEYDPQGGLHFFPKEYGLLDTHFSQRGRQGRLIRLALGTGQKRGFGIDENTALVVTNAGRPDAQMKVIGEGGVTIADLSQTQVSKAPYYSVKGVHLSYLTQDDVYAPATKTITFASWKAVNNGQANMSVAKTAKDIFSSPKNGNRKNPNVFTVRAINLFNSQATSTMGRSYESKPVAYTVKMTKALAYGSAGFKGTLNSRVYSSFKNLNVDMYVP